MSRAVFAGIISGIQQNMDWMDDANCRNMDVNLFFPDDGQNVSPFVREVCKLCDVVDECAWYANETSTEHGVFGGMSPLQRRRWRRENKVQLGMTKESWLATRRAGRLRVAPSEWNDDDSTV